MGYIDLKKLNLDELVGVVNLYPWFGGARKELCERMLKVGGDGWGEAQYADAAMYIASRGKISDMLRSSRSCNWTDDEVENLIKSYIAEDDAAKETPSGQRRVHVVGGDYFSQAEYDQVRRSDDNVFSRYAAKAKQEKPYEVQEDSEFDLYTETLAQIYLEQGYPEQARSIYSKLLLANPEKNAYFAALIQKIDELN
ncbi:MAG: hypothetical protein II989_00835 [Bacteroidales bacterium]|nr:hypothetical protein [Bacteroidales bacterium]MBQ3612613.1 hypothetical protein [Bacteroidales bacterium]